MKKPKRPKPSVTGGLKAGAVAVVVIVVASRDASGVVCSAEPVHVRIATAVDRKTHCYQVSSLPLPTPAAHHYYS